jgi:tetratricopeptide (TPR) repeat protein
LKTALELGGMSQERHRFLFARGRVYAKMGDYDRAVEDYAESSKSKNDFTLGQAEAAGIRIAQGKYEEARKLLDDALKRDPECPYTHGWKAWLAFAQGEFEEAEKRCREGLPFDRHGDATGSLLGWLLSRKGDFAEAVEFCRRAVKENVRDEWFRAALAYALMKSGDRVGALKEAEKAVELSGKRPGRAHLVRGMIRAGKGHKKEAVADLKAYLEESPLSERYPPMVEEAQALLKKLGER